MSFDPKGKRVAVIGMARSGISAAKLIHRLGGRALVSDMKSAETLTAATEELRIVGAEIETGGHQRAGSEKFDLIVLSPGVVPPPALLLAWRERDTPIWSEFELAAYVCQGRWIGVTGSNGKTTTVHLLTAMLKKAGFPVRMAGNVGEAWCGMLPASSDQVFVVEVSSFQLEYALGVRPPIAVLLNLYENHLDRHGDMQTYGELKFRLFMNQHADDVAIVNGDDEGIRRMTSMMPARVVQFGRDFRYNFWTANGELRCRCDGLEQVLVTTSEFPLRGRHNELNALAAAAAAHHFGADLISIRAALLEAKAVEHRIEFVAEKNDVSYYNDSKSTNMVATMTALDSFKQNVILLFGGRPKKESFSPLAKRFSRPVKRLIVFGEAVPKIQSELQEDSPLDTVKDMEEALIAARRHAQPGDTILLSPGCTSFDQFNNFEERGRFFKSLVQAL